MHRRNYGRRSGVVLDTCSQHGLWFDQGELDSILDWIRHGGLERAERHHAQLEAEEERSRRVFERREADFDLRDSGLSPRPILGDFIDGILAFLSGD